MCELFALSGDEPMKLTYQLREFARHGGADYANRDGWGIMFAQDRDAYLFKEPAAASESPLERLVAEHAPPSRLIMAHIRLATSGEPSLWNTHPFRRTFHGRVRHFAHNGRLPGIERLAEGTDALTNRIGETDSELAFMILLERLAPLPMDGADAERFDAFSRFCADLRALGTANILYTEGDRLYVHAHKRRYEEAGRFSEARAPGLQLRAIVCDRGHWETRGAQVASPGHRHLMLASVPLDDGEWQPLAEGETLLLERGQILHRAIPPLP